VVFCYCTIHNRNAFICLLCHLLVNTSSVLVSVCFVVLNRLTDKFTRPDESRCRHSSLLCPELNLVGIAAKLAVTDARYKKLYCCHVT